MSMEAIVFAALRGLVNDRVFPDVAPPSTERPYITYQQVGGAGVNFIDGSLPGKRNARVQINVWADSRPLASAVARQVEDALRQVAALQPTVLSAPSATYEPDTKLRGTMQDFSFWTD
jgi:hypothetical protein